MSSKNNHSWAIFADFSPYWYEGDETRHNPTKKMQIHTIRGQITLEFNGKRFRYTARRENFNKEPDQQMKKTHSNKRRGYIHQCKAIKQKLYPTSSVYVWSIFEHLVQDMYASQKVQIICRLRRPETQFRHQQGYQRAAALTGSINISQNSNIAVKRVKHQISVNTEKKLGETDHLVSRSSQAVKS